MLKYKIKDFTIIPSSISKINESDLKVQKCDTEIEQFKEIEKCI
jgi:hypothetical protein